MPSEMRASRILFHDLLVLLRGILIIPLQRQVFLLHLRRVFETLPVHLQFIFQPGLLSAQGANFIFGALDLGRKTDVSRVLRFQSPAWRDSRFPGLFSRSAISFFSFFTSGCWSEYFPCFSANSAFNWVSFWRRVEALPPGCPTIS